MEPVTTFPTPKSDPVFWIQGTFLVSLLVYGIVSMDWSESYYDKRRRVLKDKIRQEFGLPVGWEDLLDLT